MATQVQWRGGSTAEHATFTGAAREITVDTQKQTLVVHNGSTVGGEALLREDQANLPGSVTNGIYTPGTNQVAVATNGTGRLFIDASGNVGIGTTSVDARLLVSDGTNINTRIGQLSLDNFAGEGAGIRFSRTTSDDSLCALGALNAGDGDLGLFSRNNLIFATGGASNYSATTERARIDSSGRLLVGTSSALTNVLIKGDLGSSAATTPQEQFALATNSYNAGLSVTNYSASGYGGVLSLNSSKSNTLGTNALVDNTIGVGTISFNGNDGTNFVPCAEIKAAVDGTPGANDMPGRLVFSTTASGASSPTERMRINNAGILKVSNNSTYDAGNFHQFNLNTGSQWTLGVLGRNAVDPYGIRVEYTNAAPNGTVSQFLYCIDTAGVKAEIRSNGGLANYQANDVNLSDRNVKKDISPAADTWNCLKEWEIVNYRYKDQPDDADLNLGVIAQQVAESCPEVITVFQEAKDDQPEKLGVKEQQMYWMAIKALQEAQARIEALEAKVVALESKP
jgi:hypothetical protein